MSRSTFTVAILLFFTFFAIFATAAPTDPPCDEPHIKNSPGKVKDVPPAPTASPKVDNSTDTTNTTVVDDGSNDVVNLDGVNTLATSTSHSGQATWFEVGQGACGYTDTDADFIVALPESDYGSGSNCNKKLQITNIGNGRVKTATVRDMCPGCSSGSLDMSPSLFKALADDLGVGVFKESWYYV